MPYWGRVNNADDRITELVTTDPTGRYHPSMKWVKIPTYLENWINTDGDYTVDTNDNVIPVSDAVFLKQINARIARRKYEESIRGVEYNGLLWHTSESGRNNINNMLTLAKSISETLPSGETFSTKWKTLSGWTTVTIADMEAVGTAAGQYVISCFSREKDIADAIETALTNTPGDYQNAINVYYQEINKYGTDGWPGPEPVDEDDDF